VPRGLTERDVQKFRDELTGVATRLFAEHGFGGVTMRALARELGCSPMTPYRYFENKDEVFHAVRTAAFRRLGERIGTVAEGHACPLERVRAIGHEFLRFALEEPQRYRIMFQLDQTEPGEMEIVLQHAELRRGWQVLCDAMDDAVRQGSLEGDPTLLAHLYWVSLHGCVTLHLAQKLELGLALEELVDPVLDHFFRGSAPRAPGADAS
jgi:AcrR family transcriptional regulator